LFSNSTSRKRSRNSAQLPDRAERIGRRGDRQVRDAEVGLAAAEGQRLRCADLELGRPGAGVGGQLQARAADERLALVDGDQLSRVGEAAPERAGQVAGGTADLDDPPAGAHQLIAERAQQQGGKPCGVGRQHLVVVDLGEALHPLGTGHWGGLQPRTGPSGRRLPS
jgi:hypothetical protein